MNDKFKGKIMKPTIRYATEEELPVEGFWNKTDSLAYKSYSIDRYKPQDLLATIDVPLYLNYRISTGEVRARETPVYLYDQTYAEDREVNLQRLVISVPIPQVNMDQCIASLRKSLEEEKKTILAKAHQKALQIDDKIQDLLAITHKTEEGE